MKVTHQKLFKLVYTNCRNILPKLDELRCLISQQQPHAVFLCETWLDLSIQDSELLIPSFSLIRRDRNRHGGGVAIYIHDSIRFHSISRHHSIELLSLDLSLPSTNLTCCLFYRPPSSDCTTLEEFVDILPPTKTSNLLLLGDFNFHSSPSTNNPVLLSIKAKHDLQQTITTPTRVSKSSSTTIDHVYVSSHLTCSYSTFSSLSSINHSVLLVSLCNVKPPLPKPLKRNIWLYQRSC